MVMLQTNHLRLSIYLSTSAENAETKHETTRTIGGDGSRYRS